MRIVVPFPPGGGTDILARALAQKLNEAWAQLVIVDNRGGANGTIGAALVAKAPADGHTLIVVPSGFAVNPSIYKTLPFDALKDFAPITQLAASPLVLAVHPLFPPKTVEELIGFLKARPDEINYGSSGNGSPPHIATELFKLLTGHVGHPHTLQRRRAGRDRRGCRPDSNLLHERVTGGPAHQGRPCARACGYERQALSSFAQFADRC